MPEQNKPTKEELCDLIEGNLNRAMKMLELLKDEPDETFTYKKFMENFFIPKGLF